ncbi:peroxidase-like [Dermatophagoides farinae]|uniref:Peroxidase-like n=1 Tax=Dermatophagoides farinae TaxID=6954 RepID=A0A9D4P2M0_DERFA|nr:peroxidase-like [Dermatophagoides farinae]
MITLNNSRLSTTANVTEKFSNDSHNQITGVIHENFHKMSLLSSNTISSSNLKMQKFSSSWIIRTAIILMMMMMASIIQASSSSLENYFNDDTGTSIMARPSPYSPDYHPECDIILPASYSFMNNLEEMTELSPPLPTQPQSLPPLILTNPNHHHGALGGISFRSSASTMHPILQKYLSAITGNNHHITKRSTPYMMTGGGGNICLNYQDINQAIQSAKMSLGMFSIPQENNHLSSDYPKPEHVAKVGELLVKASEILSRSYGLSKEAIVYGLPRIDTTNTIIRDMCPSIMKPVKCESNKYRTLSGMCNNLEYPSWGSTRSAMLRYMPPDYADGLSAPRMAKSGQPLPPPRVVSFVLHQADENDYDTEVTYLVIAWGQMVDHDLTFASMPKDKNDQSIKCCKYAPQQRHPNCYPIQMPNDDPYYKFYPRKCMDFVRSTAGVKPNCPLGPRHQINVVSSFLDADCIYGGAISTTKRIREFNGGRLKSTKVYRQMGLKDLLPAKTKNPDQGCERSGRTSNSYCFDTGDTRSNVQLQLTVLHTIWLRHHNQIADVLSEINPHWSDEKLFQETRRIVSAMIQHITYNEFLPIVVGRQTMTKYGLNLQKFGYYHGYDAKINPGIRVEFQAAAFRFGHSIVPDTVDRFNKFHQKIDSVRLASVLRQPFSLYHPGVMDSFIFGMVNQPAYRVDVTMANEITNHLFQKPGEQFGLDLAAINILRGREMGVPGYNYMREYCGMQRIKHFTDLYGIVHNETVRRYMELYEHVDDIDFWSAGIAEFPLMGAMVGPTFACIIAEQFAQIRKGDRFWYENGHGTTKFSMDQLSEIRKTKLARILCEAADDMESIQLYPLLAAHSTSNPRVNCADLPEMDLTSWRESYLPYDNNVGNGNIAVMNTIIDDYKAKSKAKAKAKA